VSVEMAERPPNPAPQMITCGAFGSA